MARSSPPASPAAHPGCAGGPRSPFRRRGHDRRPPAAAGQPHPAPPRRPRRTVPLPAPRRRPAASRGIRLAARSSAPSPRFRATGAHPRITFPSGAPRRSRRALRLFDSHHPIPLQPPPARMRRSIPPPRLLGGRDPSTGPGRRSFVPRRDAMTCSAGVDRCREVKARGRLRPDPCRRRTSRMRGRRPTPLRRPRTGRS